jgi:hypothetical protein
LQLGFYLRNIPLKFESGFKPCYSSLKSARFLSSANGSIRKWQAGRVDHILNSGQHVVGGIRR